MLLIGKMSDHLGRKRIYVVGIALFTLGLVFCALAHSIGQLIFFRTLQAVGAAMVISCGTAIVTEAFPSNQVGKGLGSLGISVSLGFIAGPIVGGLLLDWLDWRSIFYVRIPLGLVALLMATLFLKKDEPQHGEIRLDLLGTLTSSAGIFLFVFGFSQMRTYGPAALVVYLLIGLGILLLLLFVLIERRARNPIVDPSLFKNKVFSSAIWGLFLHFVGTPPYLLIVPFYLMLGLHLGSSHAGLLMATTSVTTMVFGPISGWLSDRFKPMWFAAIGAALAALAYGLMLGFDLQSTVGSIAPVFVILGMGVGTFQPSNNSLVMGTVSREHLSTASALIATHRQVGIAVGMAVAGTLYSARTERFQQAFLQEGIEAARASELAIPLAFHDVLLLSILINVLVVILCLLPLWLKKPNLVQG
jgi:EmrB/QacA subfamily drug resistance transporter